MSAALALQVLASSRGGGAVHVRSLTAGLAARGYAVEIAVPEDGGHLGGTDFELAGGRFVALPRSAARRVVALARTLRGRRPAVVHAHGARAGFEVALARLALGAQAPPLVVTMHGYTTPFRSPLRRVLQRFAERWMDRRANLLLAVCEAERCDLAAAGLGEGGRLQVLRVGYRLDAFDAIDAAFRQECRNALSDFAGTGPIFLTVCRLDDPRDLSTLVEAFSRAREALEDATLWIVGDGPRRAAIEQQIAQLGMETCVHLLGFRRDVPNWMAASDVFVLTTEAHEGLPIALLEAQAAGLPVIATDSGGTGEGMQSGESGTLVPRCDVEALTSALEAIGADSERRARMGAAGRRFARGFSDADQMAADVAAAYGAL